MKTTKLNIGLAISKNYNVVKLEMIDEPIEAESDEVLRAKIRQKFNLLREEVNLEFGKMVK